MRALILFVVACLLAACSSVRPAVYTEPTSTPWEPLMEACSVVKDKGLVECPRATFAEAGLACIYLGRQLAHCSSSLHECQAISSIDIQECQGLKLSLQEQKSKTIKWALGSGVAGVLIGVLLTVLAGAAM